MTGENQNTESGTAAAVDPEMVRRLADIIEESEGIVFFGGAGVSTESGVPDFRSDTTRRRAVTEFGYEPEVLLSSDFFYEKPRVFYEYLHRVLTASGVEPNGAHRALAQWERDGKMLGVATQNIDGLHQSAGSKSVWELHGTLANYHCVDCATSYGQAYAIQQLDEGVPIPLCECGGMLKPDVVLYGEALPDTDVATAMNAIGSADTLIIGGTSLVVYPAAGLVQLFSGRNLVVVNLEGTGADHQADLVIREPIGALFEAVQAELERRAA